jgi:hypothetical protein
MVDKAIRDGEVARVSTLGASMVACLWKDSTVRLVGPRVSSRMLGPWWSDDFGRRAIRARFFV